MPSSRIFVDDIDYGKCRAQRKQRSCWTRVGRDLYKLENLKWVGLYPEQRALILKAVKDYFVPVTFEDMENPGKTITVTMYPGDRKGVPLFADKLTHMITRDETLSFNLIDCGW